MRVGLLTGCVGDRLKPSINRAAAEVLHRNGIEVVDIDGLGCCGALALHSGLEREGLELARRNVRAIDNAGVDRFVTTAAGCGALVRDYGRLLADDPEYARAAKKLSAHARDVTELLVEVGFDRPRRRTSADRNVAYHDACHLLHAGGIASAPRTVVSAATGGPPADLGDNALCCGSAGSYNLDHRAMGLELGKRKAELIAGGTARTISVGNVGCMLQIERAAALAGLNVRVVHPIELLAEAYEASSR
jgi:glycolate oxidase iron-sulfur subunit